jgi:hypothetical protein
MAEEEQSEYASEAEIRSAIELLDTDRLKAFEWGRKLLQLRGKLAYGRFAEGREPEDLYQRPSRAFGKAPELKASMVGGGGRSSVPS